jgi:signal transduction histidine kinase
MRALREVNRRLQELDLEKSKLFGVISHDLRSPFNAVLGYAELLERGAHDENPDRIKRYARDCRDAARSAYDLLDNLLQWARLQMRRVELAPAVFETISMIDRCIETQRAAAGLKKVEIAKELIDRDLTCFADFAAAETILRNLINNAVKFTPTGGRVTIAARADGNFTEVSVQDTGVGIADHRLDKLFALATEPAAAGTQGERGIGLGLVLCKELVERSGGRIAAESDVGRGSCLRFTLPRFGPGGGHPSSQRASNASP